MPLLCRRLRRPRHAQVGDYPQLAVDLMTHKPADEPQAPGSDNPPDTRQTGQQQKKGLTDDRRLDLENVVLTSFFGEPYRYRQADGSYNSLYNPSLGKAGSSYSRSVQPTAWQPSALPEAQLIFDTLLSREDGGFKPHPNGISSVFFYLATIIIHDIFRTSHDDPSVSLTSSYLDLAPLYGANQDEQNTIRTFKNGKLKPDSFCEKRTHGFPPGFFNRYHNWVVERLAMINERNRFSQPSRTQDSNTRKRALEILDNDLFQTGRLIVCGLYINMILHDYLRVILGLNHTASTWSLDPRMETDTEKIPRAGGNQCSFEFNLLYRWHSAISERDERWLDAHLESLPRDPKDRMEATDSHSFATFEQSVASAPERRTFGGLTRGPDGRYSDSDLARIWVESIEDAAGAFGPNNIPRTLRMMEVIGINHARALRVATLNDFRKYFGLLPYTCFEHITSDPAVAQRLQALYGQPDMVELYPGLLSEDAKPLMIPGSGLCAPYTLSRAILSDAIMNRYHEAASDVLVDDGCVFHKLVLRALPTAFSPSSIYAHLPLVTPTTNRTIVERLQRESRYSFDRTRTLSPQIHISSPLAVKEILQSDAFAGDSWRHQLTYLMGKPNHQMGLYGDATDFEQRRARLEKTIFCPSLETEFRDLFSQLSRCIYPEAEKIGELPQTLQIDLVAYFANAIPINFVGHLLPLPLKSQVDVDGAHTPEDLHSALVSIFAVLFLRLDPVLSYNIRIAAQPIAASVGDNLEIEISNVPAIMLLLDDEDHQSERRGP
ncbi:linoleate diol synthase [Verticillium alfalfae VaMs.102]|uniref:Linoleate diol synthase n=1 Tax=Verticillium alfalfae (strain VaMs.102 / ATCC MYA-4576 / FGSC 10136) TaxID=526221 RepID=C9SLA2_VERA1|nr:linoleate diol synthase [Verticillium alfalfae VaMs.102]EEY19470.1 linoleate diol synthase [Verticillium alfalfae VaMs.102]